MALEYAQIKPENIRWARERAHLSPDMLAKKLNTSEEKIVDWEMGKKKITFKQAKKLADKTLIPFGYLFLERIHKEELLIPDLRTIDNHAIQEPSAELLKIVEVVAEQQIWYKDYLVSQNIEKNKVVGRFNVKSKVKDIVADLRDKLNVANHPERGTWEEYYRLLIERIEDNGILVMRQSNLGHHTKPLLVEEFRGFAIFDPIAPVIFINQADAPSARLFTLIHELAHIWIGLSGVSDASPVTELKEEILCNAVSAEFLVPSNEFKELWNDGFDNWTDNLTDLKTKFHVSTWVLARKALTLEFISLANYRKYIKKLKNDYENRAKKEGGPTYYTTRKSQLSQIFTKALVAEALSGRMLLRDAGLLINMKPNNISKFAKELGI